MRRRSTAAALVHLTEIADYIAKDNKDAAKRVISAIGKRAELLRDNPDLGRRGHLENTRELLIPHLPYYVAYRVTESSVDVFAVIHTARRWPSVSD